MPSSYNYLKLCVEVGAELNDPSESLLPQDIL